MADLDRPRIRDALAEAGWRRALAYLVACIVLGAFFPPLRAGGLFARLGPRGRLAYVLLRALLRFGMLELVFRARQSHERVVAELHELGREPTEEEVRRHYVRRFLREELGREPTEAELDEQIAEWASTRSAFNARALARRRARGGSASRSVRRGARR